MLIAMRYAYEVLRVETVVTYVVLLLVTTCTVILYIPASTQRAADRGTSDSESLSG